MNYRDIIEGLDCQKVLSLMLQLGVENYKETDNTFIFPTICHNVDPNIASLKLFFYKNTKMFYCYTSCGALTIFNVLEEYYKTRNIDYDWYTDVFQVVNSMAIDHSLEEFSITRTQTKERYERDIKDLALPSYNEGVLKVFEKIYPIEWLNDNITEKSMDKFNILYSISQNKIIIPHYDINNNLVGIRGRALNEEDLIYGKYMPVMIENIIYKHPLSLNLYGLNFNKEFIIKKRYVFIFESEKSVLQMDNYYVENCSVAICGSNLNKYHVNILLKECNPYELILCFDKEQLSDEDDKYFNKLWDICARYTKSVNCSFLYDRENLLSLKDSPSDRGKEVFEQLIQKRVKVNKRS